MLAIPSQILEQFKKILELVKFQITPGGVSGHILYEIIRCYRLHTRRVVVLSKVYLF